MTNEPIGNTGKMVPLTIEQLRKMEKPTPVWLESETIEGWDGYWCLCNGGVILTPGRVIMYASKMDGAKFYACPPTHIDREAWGCELCKDAKFVSGIAYSEKQVDKDRACAVSFSDEGADCDFYYCPNCGKPLTPEAWAELEKRLGGLENG